jgi:FtsH-binding integral membrane protein
LGRTGPTKTYPGADAYQAWMPQAFGMNTQSLDRPRSQPALRTVTLLVGCYLGISVLALAAIVVLRNNAAAVNSAVWIRGIVVVASAFLMITFAARAARGSSRAYLRLRIVSAVMVLAIAVIIALPGTFPLWMKIEQGICGLLLIGVVVIVNGKQLRSSFAR